MRAGRGACGDRTPTFYYARSPFDIGMAILTIDEDFSRYVSIIPIVLHRPSA